MEVGDLVLIVDKSSRRGDKKKGRVVSVEGTANHIRRAHVRRADGRVVLKDRTKIVLLEIYIDKDRSNGAQQ